MEALLLTSRGVPFDVAFTLSELERKEWCMALHELEGLRYDWHKRAWRRK